MTLCPALVGQYLDDVPTAKLGTVDGVMLRHSRYDPERSAIGLELAERRFEKTRQTSAALDDLALNVCLADRLLCPRAAAISSADGARAVFATAAKVSAPCRLGDPIVCMDEADAWLETQSGYATALLEEACIDGLSDASLRLGRIYKHGVHKDRDLSRAARYFGAACERELGAGCFELGQLHETGGHGAVIKSSIEATRLHRRGCASGSVAACDALRP